MHLTKYLKNIWMGGKCGYLVIVACSMLLFFILKNGMQLFSPLIVLRFFESLLMYLIK